MSGLKILGFVLALIVLALMAGPPGIILILVLLVVWLIWLSVQYFKNLYGYDLRTHGTSKTVEAGTLMVPDLQEGEQIVESVEAPNVPSDLAELLKESIPNRFMNLSPRQLEEFICQLMKDLGHAVKLTQQSGDFGADLLVMEGSVKTVVQVKRYHPDRCVGVKEINQAIGAKNFYGCDRALVITTSYFSKPGIKLAQETTTELWDWEKLHAQIKEVYLRGKDAYEFFGSGANRSEERDALKTDKFSFRITHVQENSPMQDRSVATIIHIKMTNNTAKKINITLERSPSVIDCFGNQFEAYVRLTGGFYQGDIYPHASVEIIFCWQAWQVPRASVVDRVIVRYHENSSTTVQEAVFDRDGYLYPSIQPSGPIAKPATQGEQTDSIDQEKPEVQRFTGHGKTASPLFKLNQGLALFHFTHDGEHSFRIELLDSKGQLIAGIGNVIGKHEGSKAVGVPASGRYVMNIEADGNWMVTVEQVT